MAIYTAAPGFTGVRPAAAVPAGREIVIDGLASNVWQISIDGAVQPGTTVTV